MKKIMIILQVNDDILFNEDIFIQNVLKVVPNHVTVSMREVIEDKPKDEVEVELTGEPLKGMSDTIVSTEDYI